MVGGCECVWSGWVGYICMYTEAMGKYSLQSSVQNEVLHHLEWQSL